MSLKLMILGGEGNIMEHVLSEKEKNDQDELINIV